MKTSIYTKMAWTWQIIPNFAKLSDFVANCAQFWKFYRDFIIPRENNAMVWRVLSQNPRKKRAKKKKLLQRSKTTELTWEFPRPIAPFLFPFFFFSLVCQLRHRLPSERHRDANIVSPNHRSTRFQLELFQRYRDRIKTPMEFSLPTLFTWHRI